MIRTLRLWWQQQHLVEEMTVEVVTVARAEGTHPDADHLHPREDEGTLHHRRLENLADQHVGPFGIMTDSFCHERNGTYAKK